MSSTAPVPVYLKSAFERVERTAKLWSQAKGNSTASFGEIGFGTILCQEWSVILIWLSQQWKVEISHDNKYGKIDSLEGYVSQAVEFGGRLGELVSETMMTQQ